MDSSSAAGGQQQQQQRGQQPVYDTRQGGHYGELPHFVPLIETVYLGQLVRQHDHSSHCFARNNFAIRADNVTLI